MPVSNPRLESGRELGRNHCPSCVPNHMAWIQTWVCWLQTQSRLHSAQLPHCTAASSPPSPIPFPGQLQPSFPCSDFANVLVSCSMADSNGQYHLGVKRESMWLQRFKGSRLEIPVLSWILSCAGQDKIYGLSDILPSLPPRPPDVTKEGTLLDISVSSLITQKAEPSEVGQSEREERNESGF